MKTASSITRIVNIVALSVLVPAAQAEPQTCVPRVCAGVINAWGGGPVSQAMQPGTSNDCAPGYPCQLTTNGSLNSEAFFGSDGDLEGAQPFTFIETVDFQHPTANGAGGFCYPLVGDLTVTDSGDGQSTLVFHVQGQACQMPSTNSALLVTATYVLETASTGRFFGTSGAGTVSQVLPTSAATVNGLPAISLAGNFHIPNAQQLAVLKQQARARPAGKAWNLAALMAPQGAQDLVGCQAPRSFLSGMAVPASGLGSLALGLLAIVWTRKRGQQRKVQ